jgi:hypothetical protein
MKTTTLLLGAALALVSFSPARAVVMYGALSNFDAINDTGVTAHGFEIELDGCSTSDVSSFFGAPYNRYGDPVVTPSPTGGVIVRYASLYDSATQIWAAGTDSGSLPDTGGHSLFNGSYPGYPGTVPGDHFGIGLNVNPTNTIYRWLFDGGNGTLTSAGTSVKIPAPVLTLVQPGPGQPQPVVQAAVPAPPKENPGDLFGEAIWAKVFTTEVQNPEPVELHHLVLGDPAVPGETETEIEWQLMQDGKNGFGERNDNLNLGDGKESVTRRYEFYKYTGPFDVEGEATMENPNAPDALAYNDGQGIVGSFIGGQNVALNFAPVPEPGTVALLVAGAIGLLGYGWRRRHGAQA